MPVAKPGNPSTMADLRFPPERARTRERYRKKIDAANTAAKKAATKRASAAKKGAEGPKQSKPGGFSISRPKADTKKKRRV